MPLAPPPALPPPPENVKNPPPAPLSTTNTLNTPLSTIHEYVPGVVNSLVPYSGLTPPPPSPCKKKIVPS